MFDMLDNEKRLETIQLTIGSIEYIAEAAPESLPTNPVWKCSRIEQVSETLRTIKVKRDFQIPGAEGANLPAIFGD